MLQHAARLRVEEARRADHDPLCGRLLCGRIDTPE
jgi:hypothetical protein